MIHGLSDEEKLKVIRPILGDHCLDGNMPTIHRTLKSQLNILTNMLVNKELMVH